ncbi:hypothetical protein D3C84_596370 [compost metagenome]
MWADIVGPITEVIDFVVAEFIRRPIRRQGRYRWRGGAAGLCRAWLLRAAGLRLGLAAVLALVLAPAAMAFAFRLGAAGLAWLLRFAHFRALGLDRAGVETEQVAIGDLLLGHALDALEQFFFIGRDQRDRLAATSGAARAADAVDVVFLDIRQFEVDHMGQLVDIQAASGDIGGDHDPHVTGLEVGQGLGAGVLALVAVDRHGRQAVLVEVLGQAVGTVLGTGEHQHLFPGTGADQVREQGALVAGLQAEDPLFDALDRGVRRRDLDALGVVQQLAGEVGDVLGEGRREQQVLPFCGQAREDLLDVMHEAHVEHAVGFVQHQDFHMGQIHGTLADQVEQATGAGHQDVDALGHGLHLGVHADTAEDAGADEFQVTGIDLEAIVHLGGQFAGGGQHQHAWLFRAVAVLAIRMTVGEQQFEDRQGEAAGFTRPCLGGNHQVAALQHGGNGPLLHRGGLGVARCLDGAD